MRQEVAHEIQITDIENLEINAAKLKLTCGSDLELADATGRTGPVLYYKIKVSRALPKHYLKATYISITELMLLCFVFDSCNGVMRGVEAGRWAYHDELVL